MEDQNYAVIDGNGNVVNIVVWNGDPNVWQPAEGCTTELVTPETVINFEVG
jgi:hypothetical protein